MKYSITPLATVALLTSLAQAHFTILVPGSRGPNHDTQTTGPCGGAAAVADSDRVLFNPDGTPIDIVTSHAQAVSYVNFCPGEAADCMTQDSFNISLVNPFLEVGAGNFCIPAVKIPSSVPVGSKGTIQFVMVATDGNLYNCIDVEISNDGIVESDQCTNSTGVSGEALVVSGSSVILPTSTVSGNSSSTASVSASTSSAVTTSASNNATASVSSTNATGAGNFVSYNHGLGVMAAAVGVAVCLF